jgi:hypothetical protein
LQPAELDANGVPLTGGGFWTSTDSSGITIIYLGGGMRICDSNSPSVFLNYTAGYAALTGGVGNGPKYEDLPGDFYQALCYECATRYKELSRLGSKSEVTGQGQSMFFNTMDLQAQTKGTLGRYARGYYTLA